MTRWALITGAAGGIGQALVETFSADGYQVIATDHAPSTASTRTSASTRPCWKSQSYPFLNSMNSVLHLVLDTAHKK
jgi:NAD(P)-dependent dehydrogenase (short-subunit alcohol dehydrogenase family)